MAHLQEGNVRARPELARAAVHRRTAQGARNTALLSHAQRVVSHKQVDRVRHSAGRRARWPGGTLQEPRSNHTGVDDGVATIDQPPGRCCGGSDHDLVLVVGRFSQSTGRCSRDEGRRRARPQALTGLWFEHVRKGSGHRGLASSRRARHDDQIGYGAMMPASPCRPSQISHEMRRRGIRL